jgi:glyoxylase-like metal-dependent hydrolase (beta-lactamase superfamily II)
LKVERLIVGVLKTNCYVVKGGDEGFIIDPGGSPDAIISHVLRRRLTVRLILVTHGHPDHYSAYLDVKEALGCEVVMHELDLETASLMGMPIEPDVYVDEGSTIEVGGLRLRVLHTPGHSPGSISQLGYGLIFTGDLMFKMGYGRTDLPGGSYTTLMRSLKRILSFEGDLKVYPGHGPTTNLRDEKDFYKTFAI